MILKTKMNWKNKLNWLLSDDLEAFFSEYTDYSMQKLAPIVNFKVILTSEKIYNLKVEWQPESIDYLVTISRQINL